MSITKTREVFSLPNVHYAFIFYLMDNTIFNRAGHMRSLSSETKLHDLKTFSKFYC